MSPTLVRLLRRSSATGTSSRAELLAAGGVPFGTAKRADSVEGARAAAAELGYPVVLKALGLLHKSDAGGVALGLGDDAAVAAAATDMHERLAPEGYSVETLVDTPGGVELIVGCRRDPRFGPLVLVGLGGVYAELLRTFASRSRLREPTSSRRSCSRSAVPGSSRARAGGRRSTSELQPKRQRRSRASLRHTPRSPRSRSIRCS